jgi:hypothetical protein
VKARLIRRINPVTLEPLERSSPEIGTVYTVLEIAGGRHGVHLRTWRDDSPVLSPLEEFEITDPTLAPTWQAFQRDASLVMRPPAWNEEGFWERYFDGDSEAREIFERERAIIEGRS